jgi:hypothetical protein
MIIRRWKKERVVHKYHYAQSEAAAVPGVITVCFGIKEPTRGEGSFFRVVER